MYVTVDLAVGPARVLAPLVAKALGAYRGTAQERRDELLQDLTSPADDVPELVLRHITRAATWGILLVFVAPVGLVVAGVHSAATGGGGPVFVACVFLTFFIFFLGCVHMLKAIVVTYLLEGWWDRERLAWRAAMLWQSPDLVLAVTAAALVTASLA